MGGGGGVVGGDLAISVNIRVRYILQNNLRANILYVWHKL